MPTETTLYELYKIARNYKNTEFGDASLIELITKAEPLLKAVADTALHQKVIQSIEDAMQDARLTVIESLDTYEQPVNCEDPDGDYRRFLCDNLQFKFETKKVEERLLPFPNYREIMETCCMLSRSEKEVIQDLLRHHGEEVDDLLVIIRDDTPVNIITRMFF